MENLNQEVIKTPTQAQINELRDHTSVYVNKFTGTVLKNAMVKLGFGLEYTAEANDDRFVGAYIMHVSDMANLHGLLTKLLQAYQAQQQAMMQAAQGKVNPAFLEQLEAMKKAQAEEAKQKQ